jgi:rfaE bifunctional protein nucleotidyltransferase chain/domain
LDSVTGKTPARLARQKIHSIEELGRLAGAARERDDKVVLCHGVFDLVHMGHVRHLEAARKEGDVLIVTVTADQFVNKGPGRPIFGQDMRAEMLAALEYVDYVGINCAADAESLLDAVMPDVYVKGSDYENPEDDITGKISNEREAVERHGGRLVFTRDITFSSSNLINRYLDVYDPPLRDFLDALRTDGAAERISRLIESVSRSKVVIVGDTIIDEYQYVGDLGKPSKEHIIASQYQSTEIFAGGVIATANHAAAFCDEVHVVTTLAQDCPYEDMVRRNLKPNVQLHAISVRNRPTTRKLRYVNPSAYMRKLFEVYFMDDRPLPIEEQKLLAETAVQRIRGADVVIVNDFGHGMINHELIGLLKRNASFFAVNAQTNAGNQGYNLISRYRGADYVCVDAPEARLATGDKFSDIAMVVGESLPELIGCRHAIVTMGSYGCFAYAPQLGVTRIPAFTKTVIDTVGAGDAFFAVTAPLVAAGGSIVDAGFVGNAAGAMKVGIVGHRQSVEKIPLMKFVTTLLK